MDSLKKRLIAIILIMVAFPIALNFIISIPRLSNITVVGEDIHWLSFYGSYLGCVFATASSFYILYKTIKSAQQQHTVDLYHKEVLYFQNDMKERFSKFNIEDVLKLDIQSLPTKEIMAKEMGTLQNLIGEYRSLLYSANFLYGHLYPCKEYNTFLVAYESLINNSIKHVDNIIIFLSKTFPSFEGEWTEDDKMKIMAFAQETERLSRYNQQEVYSKANEFIEDINKTLNEMQRYKNDFNEEFLKHLNR